MSAEEVVHLVISACNLEDTPTWTLFEICNDIGLGKILDLIQTYFNFILERPLRAWEIVTDVLAAWDIGITTNALVLKKYAYYQTVSASAITGKYPMAQGYMYLEHERGKWQKRFCCLKEADLYYLKDAKVLLHSQII